MNCPRSESSPNRYAEVQACPAMTERERGLHTLEGAPLGPDSILWKTMDSRLLFAGLSSGILQLMYETIGKGVEDHSNFANEPIERVLRSMPPITETVFGTEKSAKEAGAAIFGYHVPIHGTLTDGSRYSALNPQVFADTHLTFVKPVFDIAEKYDSKGLTLDEKRQLYKECITWYQNYPVSDRYLPPAYESYLERWDYLCENSFRLDADIAGWTLDFAKRGETPRPNMIPGHLWKLLRLPLKPTSYIMGKLIIDGIPEKVREKNGIVFTDTDRELVEKFQTMIKDVWQVLPESAKYPPQAYDAFKRERSLRGETSLQDHIHTLGSLAIKDSFNTINAVKKKVLRFSPVKL